MLSLGAIAFLSPWMLGALGVLPILWWLLRVTPPAPRNVTFPPIRLLLGLLPKEETPAHTPWWLLLLRLLIAALAIVALAQPLLNPGAKLVNPGPLLLVVDDGWAAAPTWSRRVEAIDDLIDQAERAQRPVMLLTTARPANGDPLRASKLMPAGEARSALGALRPKPWPSDRKAALQAILDLKLPEPGDAVWLVDGIDDGQAFTLAERLQWAGALQILALPPEQTAHALLPPTVDAAGMRLAVLRAAADGPRALWLRASGEQGEALAREPLRFAADATRAEAAIDLPVELRNRISRIEIEGEASAGATVLVDDRWRRRPVGLASGGALETQQPLLSDLFYLQRALAPFTDVRAGRVGDLLQRELAVLVLADIGQIVGPERAALQEWLQRGGLLVRFAGPHLAEKSDDLVPVRLRAGSRLLGGAMSWSQPAQLAPFPETSPFSGLPVPADVTVGRQVLAEPDLELPAKTWARLADGTPLVTAEKRGQGWVILFHTTANTQWSNLAISGLFVEMMRRIVDLSQGIAGSDAAERLPPYALLDGFGRAGPPAGVAGTVAGRDIGRLAAAPEHPPGLYGNEVARRALNLSQSISELVPARRWPQGAEAVELSERPEIALMPWLLGGAIALALADLAIALALRGLFGLRRGRAPGALALLLALASAAALAVPGEALAQGAASRRPVATNDDYALAASLELRLAYVVTGDDAVDAMSHAGLVGLTDQLFRRTSVEAAEPMGVHLERDEIVFFPLLYWPVVATQPELSDRALARIDAFMKTGGLILFDTRDQGSIGPGGVGPGTQKLRQLLGRLDLPPLIPVPTDHVLTKAFYLTQDFPGRYSGGQVWVERHPGGANDGVSALIVGGNDWAAAWAIDADRRPLAAMVPGGAQQREMAYRFGINVVMYTLTGNYKADQVHVPALLERLGQ